MQPSICLLYADWGCISRACTTVLDPTFVQLIHVVFPGFPLAER